MSLHSLHPFVTLTGIDNCLLSLSLSLSLSLVLSAAFKCAAAGRRPLPPAKKLNCTTFHSDIVPEPLTEPLVLPFPHHTHTNATLSLSPPPPPPPPSAASLLLSHVTRESCDRASDESHQSLRVKTSLPHQLTRPFPRSH